MVCGEGKPPLVSVSEILAFTTLNLVCYVIERESILLCYSPVLQLCENFLTSQPQYS